jgi:hypothetical protein
METQNDIKMVLMTESELEQLITRVINRVINNINPTSHLFPPPTPPGQRAFSKLLTKKQICERIGIGHTIWEKYKDELIVAGMFQRGGFGSTWCMMETDLERYIESKTK